MAKKTLLGVSTYLKQSRKKRPGQHAKKRNAKKPNKKLYRGQG